jgi:hypothetical protein
MTGSPEKRKRIRIPHPRTTRQLARAITPQIRSAPQGTYGYNLACEAWTVCLSLSLLIFTCPTLMGFRLLGLIKEPVLDSGDEGRGVQLHRQGSRVNLESNLVGVVS